MSRPRNTQIEAHIAKTAFQLFIQKGYSKTTYQDIATTSGNERTLIQFYFPKKDLLIIEFLNQILTITTKIVEHKLPTVENNFVKLFAIGQFYFSFLLKNPSLTLEILSDRKITEDILFLNEDWTYTFLNTDSTQKSEELTEDIVMSLGGAYEVMYRNISSGQPVNIPRLLKKVIISFVTSLGYERHEATTLLSSNILSENDLAQANSIISSALLEA